MQRSIRNILTPQEVDAITSRFENKPKKALKIKKNKDYRKLTPINFFKWVRFIKKQNQNIR